MAAGLKPEQCCSLLSNHSLCSLQGSITENDIWTLRSAPLLLFTYRREPKSDEGHLLFGQNCIFFFYEISILVCVFKAMSLFTCKCKLKLFNDQREKNPAQPCLDFRRMCQFKWILMKEIFGVQSTAQVFCFWQPSLTCLPIISLHVSENRHDSTGKALITSSGMFFVLALGASKRLQWCSQWSLQSGLDKCSIQSEKFLSQIHASA